MTPVYAPRRLVAIVAADVAGYSRLMGQDEQRTLARLKGARSEVVDSNLGKYGGRVIGTAGDSWLAEFASAVDATRCAIEIQAAMHARACDDDEASRLLFRIGINVGDVMVDGDQIYGDGVNVAARLESAAPPGGILIAASVRAQLHGSGLEVELEDRGPQAFKNIDHPVHAFRLRMPHERAGEAHHAHPPGASGGDRTQRAEPTHGRPKGRWVAALVLAALVLAGVGGAILWQRHGTPRSPTASAGQASSAIGERRAIAVMQFANPGGEAARDYLAEGLTEDVASALGRFPSLLVLSPAATRPYRGTNRTPREIGTALGVRYVIDGSVRRAGDGVRIGAQLTDAETGILLWSERYDVTPGREGAVPDSIVRTIAGLLAARLEGIERDDVLRKPDRSLAAYDKVLRARYLVRQPGRAGHVEARRLLREALSEDPESSDARLAMAAVLNNYVQFGYTDAPGEALDEAEALARQVADREPRNARAHAMLGRLLVNRALYADAMREIETAIALNPSDHESLRSRALVMIYTGRFDEGLRAIEESRRFDPARDSGSVIAEAIAYLLIGMPDKARQVVDSSPLHASTYFLQAALAMAQAEMGQEAAAAEAAARVRALAPFFDPATFGSRFARAEDRERIAAMLRKAGLGEPRAPAGGS